MTTQKTDWKAKIIWLLKMIFGCCGLFIWLNKKRKLIRAEFPVIEEVIVEEESIITSFTFEPGFYYQFNWSKNEEFDRIFRSEFIKDDKYIRQMDENPSSELLEEAKSNALAQLKAILGINMNDNLQDENLLKPENYEEYYQTIEIKHNNLATLNQNNIPKETISKTIYKYKLSNVYIEYLDQVKIIGCVSCCYRIKTNFQINKLIPKTPDDNSIMTPNIEKYKRSGTGKIRGRITELRNKHRSQEIYINKEDLEFYIVIDQSNKLLFSKPYTVNYPINTDKYIKNPDQLSSEKFLSVSCIKNNKEVPIENKTFSLTTQLPILSTNDFLHPSQ